jgi:hypothetical protein
LARLDLIKTLCELQELMEGGDIDNMLDEDLRTYAMEITSKAPVLSRELQTRMEQWAREERLAEGGPR